ncbi:unnamed protein product [Phytophthora fragariaefolia]|uniref:Unnamed protein product n=1 Tax=Phytophthora fragariaefolia TaxID=1490495 RepID=A0A9W6XI65_9STRA|nr:unnamed protein product [Phytophthora fragariaefolia]
MYLDAAIKVYAVSYKLTFEFLAAWKELKDMPKWTSKLTSEASARAKRKAGEDGDMSRLEARKAAKKKKPNYIESSTIRDAAHLRQRRRKPA